MKKLKRSNVYVGCNRKCRFNADTIEATSYDWWKFVKIINGYVIFNNFRYSNTTARHQWETKSLLKTLNIKIDLEVTTGQTLDNYNIGKDILDALYNKAIRLIVKNNTKGIRKSTVESNKMDIEYLKEQIKKVKIVFPELEIVFSSLLEDYRFFKEERDLRELTKKRAREIRNKSFFDKDKKCWTVHQVDIDEQRVLMTNQENHIWGIHIKDFYNKFTENKLLTVING